MFKSGSALRRRIGGQEAATRAAHEQTRALAARLARRRGAATLDALPLRRSAAALPLRGEPARATRERVKVRALGAGQHLSAGHWASRVSTRRSIIRNATDTTDQTTAPRLV
ncbi:hypothetical protein MTO96_002686 [Rhipicephalus appendiculatus]